MCELLPPPPTPPYTHPTQKLSSLAGYFTFISSSPIYRTCYFFSHFKLTDNKAYSLISKYSRKNQNPNLWLRSRPTANLTVQGGQEFHFSHSSNLTNFSYFYSKFSYFLPNFSPPGGWVGPGNTTAQKLKRIYTHIGRWYGDMPPSRPPFTDQILAPKTHLFKPLSRYGDPTWIFWKKFAFQDQFLQIFSSWDTNFSKNLFRRPQF